MGKDNSSSKSELQVQLDQTNALLKKTEENFEIALRKLREEEQKNEDKRIILESFSRQLVNVNKPNVLSCKHEFSVGVAPYLTQDEKNRYDELFGKKGAEEEIEAEVTEKMTKYINGILEELNQTAELNLYLEQTKVTCIYESPRQPTIGDTRFEFLVNIC